MQVEVIMGVSRERKRKHRMDLIGEKHQNHGVCDYTKLESPEEKVPKGQMRLK